MISYRQPFHIAAGNKCNFVDNTYISNAATTKLGTATPKVVKKLTALSCHLSFFTPANIPAGIPMIIAIKIASIPNLKDTGKPSLIISFTLRPGYLNDGPKSPCTKLHK